MSLGTVTVMLGETLGITVAVTVGNELLTGTNGAGSGGKTPPRSPLVDNGAK